MSGQQFAPIDDHTPLLQPPRFTLRTLLLSIAAVGCVLAVMTAVGLLWSAAILLGLVLVMAHVLGNSLGTKLRDESTRQHPRMILPPPTNLSTPPIVREAPRHISPPQRLTQCARLHPGYLVLTLLGAVAGAAGGGGALANLYPAAGAGAIALAAVSSGVLAAMAGFLVVSFLGVARQALREALSGCDPPLAHKPRSPSG